ncbi:ATP-binding protein [Curtobacterium poinsettiae]|uniref:ATP-binding protein n=1 Tax=Curtobacterium poinsettiae TaxID=159612 RepID=UPI002362409E|nr:ATP-binding protein [Curtobacterium flaccumfaciens]
MLDSTNWVIVAAVAITALSIAVSAFVRMFEARENVRSTRMQAELTRRSSYEQDEARMLAREQREMILHLIQLSSATASGSSSTARSEAASPKASDATSSATSDPTVLVVREISHSLNTPLSQAEIALALLGESAALSVDDRLALGRAATSVAVSQSFIQAFRIVAGGDMAWEGDDDESIGDLLTRATSVLGVPEGNVTLDLPSGLAYRPAFVVAILLPLIENAIEASSPEEVVVTGSRTSSAISLTVENPSETPIDPRSFESGFSSKPSNEGLGLGVVQRLVRSVPEATVSYSGSGGGVIFTVVLPAEDNEATA